MDNFAVMFQGLISVATLGGTSCRRGGKRPTAARRDIGALRSESRGAPAHETNGRFRSSSRRYLSITWRGHARSGTRPRGREQRPILSKNAYEPGSACVQLARKQRGLPGVGKRLQAIFASPARSTTRFAQNAQSKMNVNTTPLANGRPPDGGGAGTRVLGAAS